MTDLRHIMMKILLPLIGLLLISNTSISAENTSTKIFDEGLPTTHKTKTQPYGSSLFSGKKTSGSNASINKDYLIVPGDKIKLNLWGIIQSNDILTVDTSGKIYIPEIGTVSVEGIKATALAGVVKNKIKTVYDDGVNAYVTLLSNTPIKVFVTGPVNHPGQYSGMPGDSALHFLSQAGGIQHQRGSFRVIRVLRGNQPIANIDLYQFLRWGTLPTVNFKDGDTILVGQQSAMVTVQGDARNPKRIEFRGKSSNGQKLIDIARPFESVTNVAVSGTRNNQPWSAYHPIAKFKSVRLLDGDVIRFISDSQAKNIDITIEGSHLGNSYFAVNKGTRLQELLDFVPISPDDADIKNIYIKRKRVAAQQLTALEQALKRLERSVLTAPARSDGEATIRAKEAELVLQFVENARKNRPEGRVVVSNGKKVSNVRLEDGDVVVIPQLSDVVTIAGEVQIPQAIVYSPAATPIDYIAQAGGFSERADQKRIALLKPNGKIVMGDRLRVTAGDQIMVFPKVDTKNMQFAKDITQIIYQIALGARVFSD
ncbi:MAG: Capsular polysaccharide export system periplasmic protein KpsD [uncultured Thiotrichaceae bacterium]|uniref:Capsular polysaccharide export system periplasmic protein KpsD n=1 Tax=uncultured Thiotrichaceae bacterium TaxID=298394 RepID=A0A6S6SQU9_9GAMM|nr:MAG: Capsular polysaccharide export system periplasmic protein KpsD [uncultured Thiotrichaceae bacterium]